MLKDLKLVSVRDQHEKSMIDFIIDKCQDTNYGVRQNIPVHVVHEDINGIEIIFVYHGEDKWYIKLIDHIFGTSPTYGRLAEFKYHCKAFPEMRAA